MSDVVLSGAIRSNLLSIQQTAKLLDQTQGRLATGLKVQSAVDNPQSYFTALGLNNRASDLNTLLDNQALAVQTIKAASEGIDSIQKLVQQAKATANQALQLAITPTTLTTPVTPDSGVPGDLIIQVGNNSAVTVSLPTSAMSVGAIKDAISAAGISGLAVTASGDNLSFTVEGGQRLTLSGSATGTGEAFAGTLTSSNGTNRDKFVDDYNALLEQITQLAADSSFNGVNLLQSGVSLVVNFNENQTSSITLNGVSVNAPGLGLSTQLTSDFASDSGIRNALAETDAAIIKLRTQSTSFGGNLSVVQTRQDFTKNLINTLQTGAAGLTLADTNEEGANLLALQTRQQLSITALSLANQSQQGILKLF